MFVTIWVRLLFQASGSCLREHLHSLPADSRTTRTSDHPIEDMPQSTRIVFMYFAFCSFPSGFEVDGCSDPFRIREIRPGLIQAATEGDAARLLTLRREALRCMSSYLVSWLPPSSLGVNGALWLGSINCPILTVCSACLSCDNLLFGGGLGSLPGYL